jgi:hypothetical protein
MDSVEWTLRVAARGETDGPPFSRLLACHYSLPARLVTLNSTVRFTPNVRVVGPSLVSTASACPRLNDSRVSIGLV